MLVMGAAAACSTEMDCSLNGDCVQASCHCDRGWKGDRCDVLDLKPVDKYHNGYYNSTAATWGGNVISNYTGTPLLIDNNYHINVAMMANECGLSSWGSNSFVAHLTSPTIQGPYTYKAQVIPPFAHNPQTVKGPDGYFYLFLIEYANATVKDCRNKTETRDTSTDTGTGTGTGSGGGVGLESLEKLPPRVQTNQNENWTTSVSFHRSKSLEGPWESYTTEIRMPDSWNGKRPSWLNGNSNPSPLFDDDGSVLLAVVSGYNASSPDLPSGSNEQVAVAKAGSVFGPYYWVNEKAAIGGEIYRAEDPFIWKNKRGYHILAHGLNIYSINGGRYAYSTDGLDWHATSTPAYSLFVEYSDGTFELLERRERPKLVLDQQGLPVFLVTGNHKLGLGPKADFVHTMIAPVG